MNSDKDGKRDWLSMQDPDNPYLNDLLQAIQKAEDKGLIKRAPACASHIKSVEDMLLYLYEYVGECCTYKYRVKNSKIYKVVFYGVRFKDKHISIIEDVKGQLCDVENLQEIRLVDTGFSEIGKNRIRRAFPGVDVTEYYQKNNLFDNWHLAYYDGQDEEDESWYNLMIEENDIWD